MGNLRVSGLQWQKLRHLNIVDQNGLAFPSCRYT